MLIGEGGVNDGGFGVEGGWWGGRWSVNGVTVETMGHFGQHIATQQDSSNTLLLWRGGEEGGWGCCCCWLVD